MGGIKCIRCGAVMDQRSCKVRCDRCGLFYDCSDGMLPLPEGEGRRPARRDRERDQQSLAQTQDKKGMA